MSHTANVILVLVLLCALKVPIIIPKIPETITPNVAIYMVINALSHHSVRAINNVKLPTTIADLIPPIIYPAPIKSTKVATAGILKKAFFIGIKTCVINQVLKTFSGSKKLSSIQSTPEFQNASVDIPLLCGTINR